MSAEIVKYPFGKYTKITNSTAGGGTLAYTIVNQYTEIDLATTTLTGNATINLTIDSGVEYGARILLVMKTNGTETVTPGTGMVGAVNTGAAGKTKVVEYVYSATKTAFIPTALAVQID